VSTHDVVFIGSSPNALAGAARLAKSGARVLVLESADRVGGPAATESFAPGFLADTGLSSLAIDPEVVSELGLELEIVRRPSVTSLGDGSITLRSMPELPPAFDRAVEILRSIHRSAPPEVPAISEGGREILGAFASRLTSLSPREMHEVLRLTFIPARDFLEENVGSEAVRAVLAGIAIRGTSTGPFAPGSLFGLLHHTALEDALMRSSVNGGIQRLAEGLADRARAFGAEIRTGLEGPITIEVEGGVARGVRLGDGTRLAAAAVVSDLDARRTFTRLVSRSELEPEVNRAIRNVHYRGSVARVHLALSALPSFSGIDPDALRGTLVVSPSVSALERARDEAKRGRVSRSPYIEVSFPSLADPSFAPEGRHVLDAWVDHVPYGAARASEVLAIVIDRLSELAPDLGRLVLHHRVSRPEDLEEHFGLTEGQIWGGEIALDQAFFLRPLPGWAGYESPITNLYLAGSAAHPGGYGGRSGWNAAGLLMGRTVSK
jgi:phytoene dehydrogenase-like protein